MPLFVQPVSAPLARSIESRYVALCVAAVFVLLVVAQLFTFEKFIPLVASFGVEGGEPVAQLLVSILVTLEVAAVPFLLRMRISPLARLVSMVSGWLAVSMLLISQIILNAFAGSATSNGLLGATIELPVGWWSVALMAGFAVLVAWASWGLYPWKLRGRKN